jgi:hypothetical protein
MLLSAVLLLSIATFAFAQRPGGGGGGTRSTPEETAKRTTEWMTKELKLTEKQIPKVDSINLVYAKRQSELFRNAQGGDRSQMREAAQKLNTEKETALKPILTEKQLEAYKKELEKQRAARGGGRRQQ